MKLELNVLLYTIKKYKIWYVLFILFMVVEYVIIRCTSNIEISNKTLYSLLCVPRIKDEFFHGNLLGYYQIFLHFLISLTFFNYEIAVLKENVFLRSENRQWITSKIIIFTIYTILVRLLEFIVMFVLFKMAYNVDFVLSNYLKSTIYMLFISGIVFLLFYFGKFEKIFIFINLIIVLFSYFYFNVYLCLIGFFIIDIYLILYFNAKKYLKRTN